MELRIPPPPQIILRRRLLIQNQTLPESSFSDSDESDAQFDANMVIILSFLLCALLFVIGLNAFARFGLRNPFRGPTIEQPAPPGLKKRALRQLPTAVYGSGPDSYAHECPICLGEFLDGERIRVLPKCGHGFHVGCIDTWLVSNGSCPNCRAPLAEPPPPDCSAGRGAAPEQRVIDVWSL